MKAKTVKTGKARVLTSSECLRILLEKEEEKKKVAQEKETRRQERELKKKQKEEEQKRKAEEKVSINADLCCVCFGSYQEDVGTGREWLQCSCSRWIHEDYVDDEDVEEDSGRLCPLC